MEIVLSVILSLLIGLFWMWYYYRQDVYEREPIQFIALIFVLSMPLSILAGLFQFTLDQGVSRYSEQSGFLTSVFFNLCVVALTEEVAKFFVVITVAYPNRAFNESVDGIIYAAAAALGFATFENIFYVLDRGPFVLLLRGPASTLGHVLFSAFWGAAMGLALRERRRARRVRMITIGLIISILAHGTYNILISLSYPFFGTGLEFLSLSGLVFLVFLYIIVSRQITYALDISNFNPHNQVKDALERLNELRKLQQESGTAPETPLYAPNHFLKPDKEKQPANQICSNCSAVNLTDATLCYNCGIVLPHREDDSKKTA